MNDSDPFFTTALPKMWMDCTVAQVCPVTIYPFYMDASLQSNVKRATKNIFEILMSEAFRFNQRDENVPRMIAMVT